MITTEMLQNARGGSVVDETGERIGAIGEVYLDDATGEPAWATVNTGLFGSSESFVPLDNAELIGDDIQVPYSRETVREAPRVDAGHHLDADQEQELYRYYGLGYERPGSEPLAVVGAVPGEVPAQEARAREERDASVILHEERLRVGTERVEAGRARLRRYVIGEQQAVTVPVSRESLVVERRPLGEQAAVAHELASGAGLEIALVEERPVVSRETHVVEEIGLRREVVVETVPVTTTVRREQVELESAGESAGVERLV